MRECLFGMQPVWTDQSPNYPSASDAAVTLMGELSPAWKMLLLSDGSVTRHVELLTGGQVAIDCVEMRTHADLTSLIVGEEEGEGGEKKENSLALADAMRIPRPAVQRQVFLYSGAVPDVPCVYAVSWWNQTKAEEFLTDVSSPIWANLSAHKTELHREVRALYRGHSAELERAMGCEGPFWGRHYQFWHQGEVLTVIFEAFSNDLDDFLSEACPAPPE